MKIGNRAWIIVAAAGLAGLTGCSAPAGQAPSQDPPASTSSAAQASPGATTPGSSGASSGPAAPDGETVIKIRDFAYEMPASVAPGATITVINEDTAPHTVTAKDGGAFNAQVAAGQTITFTAPKDAGDYAVICTYHPRMAGTLVVK
ncbi:MULTISPECIES: cupredoxin domain-containing protein [Micrococcaceae]|uniref:cupredoxin domain-containing protein n=1 Tax=Micrococcaceae TaxID=1268 RepID=UPI001CFF710A|nr:MULTISPECIES: cupredoxin domain-containing protein [Micrococcaceae]MCB5283926.1 Amicyanin-alpha [Arthrobacter sp. ES1]MDJ0353924.1 cupredoxin domain-containing protein [Pseudarthrobacter sp. PH31-O2]WGZ80979.1 cupredoxin domain-containing protein [Arthrobacter sp. EM1]